MRTEQELQDKLAECLTHAKPKYGKNGDCSKWLYWREFALVLGAMGGATAAQTRAARKRAMLAGEFQRAAMYSWLLEEPAFVVTEADRKKAQRSAENGKKVRYLWIDSKGTRITDKQPPDGIRSEVFEPKVTKRKRQRFLYGPAEVRKAN